MVRLAEMIYTEEDMNELRNKIKKLENEAMLDMKEITKLEKENKSLKDDLLTYIRREEEYREKIWFLEERLDNKEKVNKQLREDIGKLVKDWI